MTKLPLPHVPKSPIKRKPRRPEEIPEQCDRDDLEIAAYGIGEHGTKRQVARAYNALWKILQETF